MKTAVSLPDELYHRAERLAQRLGSSRSALYAEALAAYLDAVDGTDDVTATLDALYADDAAGVWAPGAAAGRRLIDSGEWEW